MISASWASVKPETIKNCFKKAGWEKADQPLVCEQAPDEEDNDNIPLSVLRSRLHLPDSLTFEDYVSVDDCLETSEALTEATIISELTSEPDPVEEDEEEEEETVEEICSLSDAKKKLQEIRHYFFSCQSTSDADFSSLHHLESTLCNLTVTRQSYINDFFPQLE